MGNHLIELEKYDQSVWYDNISRDLISSGELSRMVNDEHLKGVTSNPTIFDKAISGSDDYDDTLARLVREGERNEYALFEKIAIKDIQDAADILNPVYKKTDKKDGYVSIEVSPKLAYNTERTIEEARRLFKEVDRPNVMIKVPATREGLPAIEALISEGINVNVTLIFSINRYEEVAGVFIRGLEKRLEGNLNVNGIASVASFFVSRIDTAVDNLLKDKENSGHLLGKTAVANAKLAYQRYKDIFHGSRFERLKKSSAMPQRVLWASTSTKNPDYNDLLYVNELIGRETVNTIPPKTFDAFKDHGDPQLSLETGLDEAKRIIDSLGDYGVSLEDVTQELEDKGVKSFAASFESLLSSIRDKIFNIVRISAGTNEDVNNAKLKMQKSKLQ